jgi:hypothetical protein
VHEITDREERLAAIAREYLKQPQSNADRVARQSLAPGDQSGDPPGAPDRGQVAVKEQHVRVLVARQEVTGADRQWAAHYHPGDVVRYTNGSHTYRLTAGEYARVVHVNTEDNHVTVRRARGPRHL